MNFKVTVLTFNGQYKTLEVNNMPSEEAARAEAVAMTFGRVMGVERTDKVIEPPKYKIPKGAKSSLDVFGDMPIKPGETQVKVTGYNNNPIAVFKSLGIGWDMFQ